MNSFKNYECFNCKKNFSTVDISGLNYKCIFCLSDFITESETQGSNERIFRIGDNEYNMFNSLLEDYGNPERINRNRPRIISFFYQHSEFNNKR